MGDLFFPAELMPLWRILLQWDISKGCVAQLDEAVEESLLPVLPLITYLHGAMLPFRPVRHAEVLADAELLQGYRYIPIDSPCQVTAVLAGNSFIASIVQKFIAALDSFFVIYSPTQGKPLIFKQRVLPFGSIASVTGFIRSGLGLWSVSVRLLALVWSMYFDDFLHLTQGSSARRAELVIGVFFRLLGWEVSADKLCPYDSCCKVLGVMFDLRQAHLGTIFVRNTEKRRTELSGALRSILKAGRLSPKESERLRGRLQFSAGQLFGRRAKSSLHSLARHSRQQVYALSHEVAEACAQLLEMLEDGPEREISSALGDVVHVFVDASFEPNGAFCGIGGIAYCGTGHVLRWFGCRIDPPVTNELLEWDGESKETIIFELECMAVFAKVLANRSIVVFTDNQGVLGALVKGWSTSALGHAITLRVCILEEGLHSYFWYDRVPNAWNPSDPLSRDDFSTMDPSLRCEVSNADVRRWIESLES